MNQKKEVKACRGTALVLLCAVALTYGENNVIRRNAAKCNCDPTQAMQICENNFEKTDVVVAHEYCNKFYLCISGKPFGYECPPSLLFDPVKEKCEQPELVDCAGRLLVVHDEERYRGSEIWVTTSFPEVSNGFLQTKDSLNIFDSTYNKYNCSGGACDHKPKEATFICSNPESRGFLIPHEKCNKFYRCDYNKPMEFTCHEGTAYNPQKGICEWSSEVECGERLMPDTYEDDTNNHTNVKNVDGENTTVNNVDGGNSKVKFDRGGKSIPDFKLASSICALPHSSGILITHEKCNKFYQCDNNKPVEVTCYNGTFYNPNNEKCDLPSKVECGDRLISDIVVNESIQNGYNADGGQHNEINDNDVTRNCDPEKAPSICASPGSNGTMIAHKSCNKFYKCDLNRPIEFTCPHGTLYDPYKEKCDWSNEVECGNRLNSDIYNDALDYYNNNEDTNNGNKNNDDKDNGKTCNCDPEKAPSICASPGSSGTLIAHKNCGKFYKCNQNRPVEFTCHKGTLYNPYKEKCDWSSDVKCGDRFISNVNSKGRKYNNGNYNRYDDNGNTDNVGNNNGGSIEETNNNGVKKGGRKGNHNRKQAQSICTRPGSNGILIAHKKCNKFYKCIDNKPVVFTCPRGRVFNTYRHKCDLQSKVECGDRLISESNENISNENAGNSDGGTYNDGNENAVRNTYGNYNYGNKNENNNNNGNSTKNTNNNGGKYNNKNSVDNSNENSNNNIFNFNFKNNTGKNEDGNNESDSNNDGKNKGDKYNHNLEQAYSTCAKPDSNGTLIVHTECNKFYKCNDNIPVEFTCRIGTVYNPVNEECDWSNKVDCGDRWISESDDDISKENFGNSNGSVDDGGNDNLNNNNNGKNHNNNNNGKNLNNNNNGKNNIGIAVHNESSIDKNNKGIRDYGSTEKPPFICAGPGSSGKLVAHQMCNKFYKCDQNRPVEYTCGKGTVYDPYKAKCELPSKVECGDRLLIENDDSSVENIGNNNEGNELLMPLSNNGSNDLLFSSSLLPLLNMIDYSGSNRDGSKSDENVKDGPCNCNPKQAPFICAKPGSTGSMITHEMCNKYYKCDHNKPVAFTCANGTVYNPYKEICDRPSKVECGDRLLPFLDDKENNKNCSNKVGNVCVGSKSDDDVNGGNNNDKNDSDENDNCNCNPDLAPSICANPGSNDIMIAHEMCYKFYKCDHSSPVEFTCPNGTVYNPYKEICDWPNKVECGDRLPLVSDDSNINKNDDKNDVSSDDGNANTDNNEIGSGENNNDDTQNYNPKQAPGICAKNGSNGILIAHEKCNKFYKCDRNRPVEFSCPNATLYNSKKKKCDEPSNVDCGNVNRNYGNNNKGFDNDDNDNSGFNDDGGCNCNPEDAPAICAHPDSSDILIAHEMCHQFYKCIQNKPVEFSCSSGLLYNPYKEICDWPNKVECGDRMLSDFEKNGNNKNDNNTDGGKDNDDNINRGDYHSANDKQASGKDDKCNCDPEEAPIICAKPDSSGTLIAHKKCNKFYVCDQGKPLEFICRGIELYDPYEEKCDLPHKVDCGDRLVPSIDDNEGYGGNKNNNGCDDNGGTCNWSPEKALTICANPFSNGSLLAHKMCNKFYKCHLGNIFEFYCPKGMIYNPYKKICDLSSITTCGDRLLPDADVNGNNSNANEGDNNENNNDEKANISNNIDGTCNCNPEDAPLICANPDSDGILVAHEKCNKFYRCNHEKPMESTCPKNTLYNPYKEKCDWPKNVECGNRVNTGSFDNDLPILSILLNNDNNQVHNIIKKINDNPEEAPSICAVSESSNGILIAHKNCNQFYMCGNGTPIAFKCPQGTLYNPVIEKCDWGEGVDCSDRIISGPKAGNNNKSIGYDARTEDLSLEVMPNVIDNDHNQSLAICLQSDGREIFIMHESCNKFYRCVNGTAIEMQCGGDLLFNPLMDQCDWPINVDCGRRTKIETDVNCACNPKNAPALCARQNTDGKLIAHENCNQYYVCIKGLPMPRYCKKNLLYNIETEECDVPQNVDCSTRSVVTKKSAQNNTES